MKRIALLVILFSLVMLSANVLEARQIDPRDGLEALRRGFAGMNDFTAEITQEKRLSLMRRTLVSTGTVRFRKPDLFYLEMNPPHASRMVLRDATIEQMIGSNGERNRIVLSPDQGLKRWLSRLTTPVTAVPEGMSVRADLTAGVYTLTIAPQGKGQIRELVLVFQEDGTIRRLVMTEQNGDTATLTFRKVRRNIGLAERDFRLD